MQRKDELAAIAARLSAVDIAALAGEVKAAEEANRRFEHEYGPLREKKAVLAREADQLAEAVRNRVQSKVRVTSYGSWECPLTMYTVIPASFQPESTARPLSTWIPARNLPE